MSVVMEQHQAWQQARARLDGGNKRVRVQKAITLKTVASGKVAQVVRISADIPLPTAVKLPNRPKAGDPPRELPERTSQRATAIVRYVASKYGVSFATMKGDQRFTHIVAARQEAYYRLLMEAAMSSTEISRMFGGKDRTTIMYGARIHAKRTGRLAP